VSPVIPNAPTMAITMLAIASRDSPLLLGDEPTVKTSGVRSPLDIELDYLFIGDRIRFAIA